MGEIQKWNRFINLWFFKFLKNNLSISGRCFCFYGLKSLLTTWKQHCKKLAHSLRTILKGFGRSADALSPFGCEHSINILYSETLVFFSHSELLHVIEGFLFLELFVFSRRFLKAQLCLILYFADCGRVLLWTASFLLKFVRGVQKLIKAQENIWWTFEYAGNLPLMCVMILQKLWYFIKPWVSLILQIYVGFDALSDMLCIFQIASSIFGEARSSK